MQSEYRHRRTGRRRRKRNYNIDEMKDWKDEKLKDENHESNRKLQLN